MRVPPEIKNPMLLHAPTRKPVACLGCVSLSTGKFVPSLWTKRGRKPLSATRFGCAEFLPSYRRTRRTRMRAPAKEITLE